MSFVEPTTEDTLTGFSVVPSTSTSVVAVAGRVLPVAEGDASYLQGAPAPCEALFDFPWPFSTSDDYGDNHSMVRDTITSITFAFRLSAVGGTSTVAAILNRDSTSTQIGDSLEVDSATVTEYSVTATTDPVTSEAWNPADFGDTVFGVSATAVGGAAFLRVHRFWTDVTYTTPRGNARARLKPNLMEPALFCAICGFPDHIRGLIKIEEPRHPHVGLWVCQEDVDKLDREPISPELVEGDIDFDL